MNKKLLLLVCLGLGGGLVGYNTVHADEDYTNHLKSTAYYEKASLGDLLDVQEEASEEVSIDKKEAVDNELGLNEKNSLTIKEAEDLFFKFMEENYPEIKFGTPEYVEYCQRINDKPDEKLTSQPDYKNIYVYVDAYLASIEGLQESEISSFTMKDMYELKTLDIIGTNELINKQTKAVTEVKVPTTVQGAPANLNFSRAMGYMNRWWNGRNPMYTNEVGRDCTNYASQVLKEAGLPLDGTGGIRAGISGTTRAWYSYPKKPMLTSSWINVPDFYAYLVGTKGYQGVTVPSIISNSIIGMSSRGDIIQFRNSASRWYHTAVVTEIHKPNTLFYSAHSTDYIRRNLSDALNSSISEIRIIKMGMR